MKELVDSEEQSKFEVVLFNGEELLEMAILSERKLPWNVCLNIGPLF